MAPVAQNLGAFQNKIKFYKNDTSQQHNN